MSLASPEGGSAGGGSGAPVAKPVVARGKVPVRRPDVDTLFSINPDGSRNAVHPADVHGRFQWRKNLLWVGLIGLYLAVPWLRIGERPVLMFDLPNRHFYLLGLTFNAQDFWLAFFFITGIGFGLFVVAGLFGRVWCGFACPQTVFLEGVYRRIERWIEGPAAARAKLDKAPLAQRWPRRGLKLLAFALVTAVITHSFLGYFMPVEVLQEAVLSSPGRHPTAFLFMLVSSTILFINYTWFREQLCIAICPYGRLQGALYDPDTIMVGYDQRRGEPRGKEGTEKAGDCIDCYRCVAVCPTGIDIRNGTQLECIGCSNCIDACDDVMAKVGRPAGLVRYDSQRGFEQGTRRFLRGRVLFYAILMLMGIGAFSFAITKRKPFESNLVRAIGMGYKLDGDRVHNIFELHLINKRPGQRSFQVRELGPKDAEIVVAIREIVLEPMQDLRIPVHVFLPRAAFQAGLRCELEITCVEPEGVLQQFATAPLLGPSVGSR